MKKSFLTISFFVLIPVLLLSQSKPFPQNADFPYGYQTDIISAEDIQEAYTRWKSNFLIACNGMYRVSGDDNNISISEGMGYGMLLTAYFGEKEYFDGLLEFYKSKRTDHAFNLMAWRVTCDDIIDPGSATDGDLDVAFALIIAYNQWERSYLDDAREIISILKEHYFVTCEGTYTMKPGGYFGGCDLTDISYYTPAYFRIFAEVTHDPFWNIIAEDSYVILENGANDTTGLVPDWQSSEGVPGGDPPTSEPRCDYYRYDACRVPCRMSLDYLWNGNEEAHDWCTTISNFAGSIGAANIVDGYDLDGTPRGQYNNSPFVGGFAVGSMCNNPEILNDFAARLIYLEESGSDDYYFNLSLRCIYMLVLTGNFWKPGSLTEVNNNKIDGSRITVFPNPANDRVFLTPSSSLNSEMKIELIDSKGMVLHNFTINTIPINIARLPDGIYFLRIRENNSTNVQKIIIN